MANPSDFNLEELEGKTLDGQAVTDFEEAFHEPHFPRYMGLVTGIESGKPFYESSFFEDYIRAEQFRMDASCGMGYYAEIYERVLKDGCVLCYEFVCA